MNVYSHLDEIPSSSKRNSFIVRADINMRFHVFGSYIDFINHKNNTSFDPCWHECIFPNNPRKFFLDIDWTVPNKTKETDVKIQKHLNAIYKIMVVSFIEKFNRCSIDKNDIIKIDSSGQTDKGYKYSYNLIVMKYSIPDQYTFADIGCLIIKKYLSINGIRHLIDENQFGRSGVFTNRLPGSTKYKDGVSEQRFKKIPKEYKDSEEDLFICNVSGLPMLPSIIKDDQETTYEEATITDEDTKRLLDLTEPIWRDHNHYRETKGGTIFLQRNSPEYCLVCDHTHERDSSYYIIERGDWVYLKCFKTNKDPNYDGRSNVVQAFYTGEYKADRNDHYKDLVENPKEYIAKQDKNTVSQQDKNIVSHPKVIQQDSEIPLKKSIFKGDTLLNIDDSLNYCSKVIKSEPTIDPDEAFPDSAIVNLVKAEMKMGKTKSVCSILDDDKYDDSIMNFVSFRRTFSIESSKKFKDFNLYSEIKEQSIDISIYKRLIIQAESLNRVNIHSLYRDDLSLDILILDEIESIWTQFNSGNFPDWHASVNIFMWMVKHAKKIIIMDANLSKRTTDLLEIIRPGIIEKTSLYWNKYNPSSRIKYYFVDIQNVWVAHLGAAIKKGENIMIFTNSLKSSRRLHKFVASTGVPVDKIMMYTSETLESIKTKHFRNVNHYWSQYQVVICTPTISAGVSFEKEHFNKVFGLFTDRSCNVQTCMQMIGRVRNVADEKIFIHVIETNHGNNGKPLTKYNLSIKGVEDDMIKRRYDLVNEFKNHNNIGSLGFSIQPNGLIEYEKTFPYWIIIYNIVYDNHSRNSFKSLYMKIITDAGGKLYKTPHIEKTDIVAYSQMYNGAKTEALKTLSDKVNKAKLIDIGKFTEISEKMKKIEDVPEEEIIEYEKFKMIKTINVKPEKINDKLVDMFYRSPHNLRRYKNTDDLIEGFHERGTWEGAIDYIMDKDRTLMENVYEKGKEIHYNRMRFNYTIHIAVKKMFEAFNGFSTFDGVADIRDLFHNKITMRIMTDEDREKFDKECNNCLGMLDSIIEINPKSNDADMCSFEKMCIILNHAYMLSYSVRAKTPYITGEQHIVFYRNDTYYLRGKKVKPNIYRDQNLPLIYM